MLVVEDDLMDKTMLQRLLAKSSLPIADIKYAEFLDEAIELLDRKKFDVVLLDLNLPDSNGIETLVRIVRKHPDVANVVITGECSQDFALEVVASGAQDYLVKGSYNIDTLSRAIYYAIERKRTDEILDRKQKNIEAIFDAVSIGMLLVDENLEVKRVNDAIRQMVNKDYSHIINRRVGSILCCINSTYDEQGCGYSPACAECSLHKIVESVIDSGKSAKKVEVQPTLNIDGKEVTPWFCISAEPVIIDKRKHVVVSIEDITDRKRTEEKLKETMELKSQFISTVSHELRTPLASMKEAVAIVYDGAVGKINAKQKKFLSIAKRNVDRLARLINDVLDFQKFEADKMKPNMHLNDISKLVREVYTMMLSSAKQKKVDFTLKFENNVPKARLDGDKITQVLTNLVDNAIKFTPEQGQVSVCVQHRGEELVICVSDTGIGIPEEHLLKIFDRFYHVAQPGEQIRGTGLGLAIVKRIVTMHGGRIEVESELNKGTTFTIFLPLTGKCATDVAPVETKEIRQNTVVK